MGHSARPGRGQEGPGITRELPQQLQALPQALGFGGYGYVYVACSPSGSPRPQYTSRNTVQQVKKVSV